MYSVSLTPVAVYVRRVKKALTYFMPSSSFIIASCSSSFPEHLQRTNMFQLHIDLKIFKQLILLIYNYLQARPFATLFFGSRRVESIFIIYTYEKALIYLVLY